MRCHLPSKKADGGIPLYVRRSLEETLSSFYWQHYRVGAEALAFLQMDKLGDRAWRVWMRQALGGAEQASGQPRVAMHTTSAYVVQVLRTVGKSPEFGLLHCLEVVCTYGLQMQVALDQQIAHLLSIYGSNWGRGRPPSPRLCAEVPASALAVTGCFSPEDRLWTIRSLVTADNAAISRPEALVLLYGRTFYLVSNWSVFLDQVFVRQQHELQQALELAVEQGRRWHPSGGQSPSSVRVTAFGALDHPILVAIAPAARRSWHIRLQLLYEASDNLPLQLLTPWGSVELDVLALQQHDGGPLHAMIFNHHELEQRGAVLHYHAFARSSAEPGNC
jgi:hypothetical protein